MCNVSGWRKLFVVCVCPLGKNFCRRHFLFPCKPTHEQQDELKLLYVAFIKISGKSFQCYQKAFSIFLVSDGKLENEVKIFAKIYEVLFKREISFLFAVPIHF